MISSNMTIYASCLLVDSLENPKKVLLIKKNRPLWQEGKLNIIGGHVEDNEEPKEAAIREVSEEVGFSLDSDKVRPFCVLETETPGLAKIYFFVAEVKILHNYIIKTDEEPVVVDVNSIIYNPDVIPNLKYIIPMALNESKPFGMIHEC